MIVKRVVANVNTQDIAGAERFYHDILGLDLLMDHGWITTYGSNEQMSVQISFASQGGSGTPTPDLSIEVDDVDDAFERMTAGDFRSHTVRPMSLGAFGALSTCAIRLASW